VVGSHSSDVTSPGSQVITAQWSDAHRVGCTTEKCKCRRHYDGGLTASVFGHQTLQSRAPFTFDSGSMINKPAHQSLENDYAGTSSSETTMVRNSDSFTDQAIGEISFFF